MAKKPVLRSLSDVYAFFRQNQKPIYFLSPTPYNILGLGRWINKFEYINFFDSFDGTHPKAMVPREHGPHEFRSIEDVNNHLLRHPQVRHYIKDRAPGYLLLVMLDEETEALAKELGMKIALPRVKLRKWIDSKIVTTKLGNEAGVKSAPRQG
jgi:biotin carboxylase